MADVLTHDYLYELYWRQGLSSTQIAERSGCSHNCVLRYMKSHGIPRRGNEESQAVRNGVYVNEEFFSEWNPDMAYVLGFAFADGYISKSGGYVFELTSTDLDVLEKIASVMHYIKPLKAEKVRGDRRRAYKLIVAKKKVYDDLIRIGLTPQKSFTMRMPDAPEHLVRHFVRGFFDGNGSVAKADLHYKDTTYKRLNFRLTTASEGMANDLLNALSRHLPEPPKLQIQTNDRRSSLYHVCYYHQDLIPIVYHWLYDDVPNRLWMDRKYNRFASFYGEIPSIGQD